jgi:hypothetical protein
MTRTKTEIVPSTGTRPARTELPQRLRGIVAHRTEEILAEVAPTVRRFRTFLLVVMICIPVFTVGLIAALWHLAH